MAASTARLDERRAAEPLSQDDAAGGVSALPHRHWRIMKRELARAVGVTA